MILPRFLALRSSCGSTSATTLLTKVVTRRTKPRRRWTSAATAFSTLPDVTPDNVVVALSGGVDSAVALGLLLQQPTKYQVKQVIHMTNWNPADDDSLLLEPSCVEQDWRDAQAVVQQYQQTMMYPNKNKNHHCLELKRVSFEQTYWHEVFVPFLQDLSEKGWMGNPDVACNVHVKFGALWDVVRRNQTNPGHFNKNTWLATGHYARLWRRHDDQFQAWMEDPTNGNNDTAVSLDDDSEPVDWVWRWGRENSNDANDSDFPLLVSAVDTSKDQSYFLSACTSAQFARVLFPLGEYYKSSETKSSTAPPSTTPPAIRQLAQQWHLPVAQKRDSVGICFIGKRKGGFQSFLEQYYEPAKNDNQQQHDNHQFDLVDVDTGATVGVVNGLKGQALTIGQGARLSGSPHKYFVVGKSFAHHSKPIVWVCGDTHHPALYADTIQLANDVSWIMSQNIPSPLAQNGHMRIQCRIRHLQPLVQATLLYNRLDHSYSLALDKPLRGITPGQRAAFYIRGICLGGATIAQAGPSYLDLHKPLPPQLHPAGANDTTAHTCS